MAIRQGEASATFGAVSPSPSLRLGRTVPPRPASRPTMRGADVVVTASSLDLMRYPMTLARRSRTAVGLLSLLLGSTV